MRFIFSVHQLFSKRFSLLMLLVCVFAAPEPATAQRQFDQSKEVGLTFGTAYYKGDLNPEKHFGGRLNGGVGGYYRHNFSGRLSMRINLFKGMLEAWDEDSDDPWQRNRNLHFRNNITELSALFEINYLEHRLGNPGDRLTAFLFTGLGFFNHMPEASLDGNWIPLQPLGTEGQGTSWGESLALTPYATAGVSLPFGFGFKVNMGPFTALCIEWGVRKTWTDYLDDVSGSYADALVLFQERGELSEQLADRSIIPEGGEGNQAGLQRGDPGQTDAYGFMAASLSFRISKKPTTCWGK